MPWSWRSRGSRGSQHPRAEHPRPAGLRGDVSGWVWGSPTVPGPAFGLTPWIFELSTISAFPAGPPQGVCGSAPRSYVLFFPPPADAWGKMLSVPSDHRSAQLACPSPAFLFVPRAKDAPEARAHSPSLHSEPAVAIRQLLLFPKKTCKRPRSERRRAPRTSGPGEWVEWHRRQSPSSLLAPFAPLPYVLGADCGCAGVVLSWDPAGWRRSPKVAGRRHPGVLLGEPRHER